jgi:hypothetical protein
MNGVGAYILKLALNLTGYKMREKIGNTLKTHVEAIQQALDAYNAATTQLNPPCKGLTWAKLMETMTLANFDLLCDSR